MIHKYRINDTNIVLDVYSGSIHVLDDLSFEVLDHFRSLANDEIISKLSERYQEDEIKECLDELTELENAGLINSSDVYAENTQVLERNNPVVKALCLHIAHDCNLACKYCFASEGEYNSGRSLMSEDVGKNAIDFLIKNSGNRRNLEVDFFGGEPTLNFDTVKKIVEYARSKEEAHNKNFRFTLTTNGVLLNDDIIEYCNSNMHNVVLSLDGRKEVNDLMRPDKAGKGSYEKIVPKFLDFVAKRGDKSYYVRGTFTKENMDFSRDVLHLSDLGFKQISIEPVVAPDNASYSLTEENISFLENEYEKLLNIMVDRIGKADEFNFFHFNIDLTGGSCAAKRIAGCGAGCEYMSVTPTGDLYPCHQFVGIDNYRLGDVYSGIINSHLIQEFLNVNVYSKPDCKECWAKFYCSGGCAANAYQFANNILGNYELGCKLQRKRIECAIYLQQFSADELS